MSLYFQLSQTKIIYMKFTTQHLSHKQRNTNRNIHEYYALFSYISQRIAKILLIVWEFDNSDI